MKDEEDVEAPLTEAFGKWGNLKWVLIALMGAVAGQAVVWYTETSAVEITLKIQFLVNKTSQYSHIQMLLKCIILRLQHH